MLIVKCKDYNGSKNVLFQMCDDDDRIATANYSVVTNVTGKKRNVLTGANGKQYKLFSDWSVQAMQVPDCS